MLSLLFRYVARREKAMTPQNKSNPTSLNLTLYSILSIIESWKNRNGYYPTEIFKQLDGAKDNANKCVLGMLEILVVKRMAQVIYFTRLPVGHTH